MLNLCMLCTSILPHAWSQWQRLCQHVKFVHLTFVCCLFNIYLLLTGASVNAKDHVWLTPLHRAAASRNEVGHLCHQK